MFRPKVSEGGGGFFLSERGNRHRPGDVLLRSGCGERGKKREDGRISPGIFLEGDGRSRASVA